MTVVAQTCEKDQRPWVGIGQVCEYYYNKFVACQSEQSYDSFCQYMPVYN